jgi:hypothetical protein
MILLHIGWYCECRREAEERIEKEQERLAHKDKRIAALEEACRQVNATPAKAVGSFCCSAWCFCTPRCICTHQR